MSTAPTISKAVRDYAFNASYSMSMELLEGIIKAYEDDKGYTWTPVSVRNPSKKGYYAVRYRSRLVKNANVFVARYRKGKWEHLPKGFKWENIVAWCCLPDASPLVELCNPPKRINQCT